MNATFRALFLTLALGAMATSCAPEMAPSSSPPSTSVPTPPPGTPPPPVTNTRPSVPAGTITGVVLDADGPVAGAMVRIQATTSPPIHRCAI